MSKYFIGLWMILIGCALVGCSHDLVVTNLDTYTPEGYQDLGEMVDIGVRCSNDDEFSKKLIRGISSSLSKYGANVVMPYNVKSAKGVDHVVDITIDSDYSGSGWNFLINFPGFLIFMPAWHGYDYTAEYNFDVVIKDASGMNTIDRFQLPVVLDLRHADINRTWTEVSWFEVGAIAFLGGIYFTKYDDDVTPTLVSTIDTKIGDYVANEIVARLNNLVVQT